jgi:hypothetical protein
MLKGFHLIHVTRNLRGELMNMCFVCVQMESPSEGIFKFGNEGTLAVYSFEAHIHAHMHDTVLKPTKTSRAQG